MLIYYNKFNTSNLIISNDSSLSTELLDWNIYTTFILCPLGDCVSNENKTYVSPATTTLSKRLTMHLNDSSSIALHLKTDSMLKVKLWKLLETL